MNSRRWITRIGSLLVLFGFFLPSVLVSCSSSIGLPGVSALGQSFSLSELANSPIARQGMLYLVPILILATVVLSFMTANFLKQERSLIWGQLACAVASFLVIVIAAANLSSQMSNLGNLGNLGDLGLGDLGDLGLSTPDLSGLFEVKPDIGAFVLLIGYVLAIVGLAMQLSSSRSGAQGNLYQAPWSAPAPSYPPAEAYVPQAPYTPPQAPADYYPPPPVPTPAPAANYHLELVSGQVSQTYIPLQKDNILLGRGSECDVQLLNPTISRAHARLRLANNTWFIQDQNSTAGTLINGQPERARALKPGDTITLGEVTYIFKM